MALTTLDAKTALIVVDLQQGIVALPTAHSTGEVVERSAVLAEAFRRHGLPVRDAIGVALAADTVSIVVMEVIDNAFILAVPGAMAAGLGDALFWRSLAAALAIAFVLTVPVNRWMIGRGRGHAAVHAMH